MKGPSPKRAALRASLSALVLALPLFAAPAASALPEAASAALPAAQSSVQNAVQSAVSLPQALPGETVSQDAPATGIISTDPTSGEQLNPAPSSVSVLLASAPVESSMTVIVKDAKGKQWDQGFPQLDGSSMRQPVDPNAPVGAYTVFWAYTSTSGEYFQGQFSYKVTTGSQAGSAQPDQETQSPASKTDAENQAVEAAGRAQAQSGQVSTMLAVVIGLGIIAVLIVGLSARRKLAADAEQARRRSGAAAPSTGAQSSEAPESAGQDVADSPRE